MSKKKKLSATSITRVMESRAKRSTGAADPRQQRLQESQQKKKRNPMKIRGIVYVDYKDVKILERYTNEHGKMLPRRYTAITAAMQRQIETAIRQARHLALLPFVGEGMR